MYGILLLCLLLRTMAFSSHNKTTDSQPSSGLDKRHARDAEYIGCYPLSCFHVDNHVVLSESTTPDVCTATCKENGFHIAALYNITECACSFEQTCIAKPLDDHYCDLPCRERLEMFCGGYTAAAVYTFKPVISSKNKCSENTIGGPDDDDYIGCYDPGCFHFDYDVDGLGDLTTPDSCTATCKENGFRVAGVYNGTKCSCSCEQTCTKPLGDENCGLPCLPAPIKRCGGYTAVSVYTVHPYLTPNIKYCDTGNEKDNTTTYEAPSNPLIRFAVPISIVVAIVIISVVAGVLVTVITKRYRERINTERHQMSVQDNRVQDRDDRVATVTQYQPLRAMPKRPDIPQADAKVAASSCTGVKDGIYKELDLGERSVPTTFTVLAHEYLVLGQEVPLRIRSSDECHEYNYPEMIQSKPNDPVRESRVGGEKYLTAEPDIQGLPNPRSKVYYSSRLPK